MFSSTTPRRRFLKQATAGLLILPSGMLFGANTPNNRLNLALIGAGGRATQHFGALAGQNVVALCDIDENHLAEAAKRFPGARIFTDWRRCLEMEGIDAILCSTTDHTHAHIAIAAMRRGLHVYCEKPLAVSVEEARAVRKVYLECRDKVATQVGTQLHANNNFRKVRELVRAGAVGELKSVHAWGSRRIPKPGYFPAGESPPAHLHYDLWLGPAPFHPYHPGYFNAPTPGSNCLNWNMFWDFGAGQVGDMGSHTMDLAWNALDAGAPVEARAEGDPLHPEVTPVKLHSTFVLPANDWRPSIELHWHQGGAMPAAPTDSAFAGIDHGAMFVGTTGSLVAGFGSHAIIPAGTPAGERVPRQAEKGGYNFHGEWFEACKGNKQTSCNFDYAGQMIETMLLGLAAYRAGGKIRYDPASGSTGDPAADRFLRKPYREGWALPA